MNDKCDCRRRLLTITLTILSLLCATNACDADAGPDANPAAVAGAAGKGEASAAGAGTEPAIESDWCAVRQVLVTKCQRCHASPPEHGAPFPLVTYADTQVLSARGAARFVAIEAAISKDFMPPSFIALEPPVARLLERERDALLAWCRAGGPSAMQACDGEP